LAVFSTAVKDITEIVIRHQTESLLILKEIEDELQTKIFSINEDEISEEQEAFKKIFSQQPVTILNDLLEFPLLGII
jgi:polyphosphate kinase